MVNLYRGISGLGRWGPWFPNIVDALRHYSEAEILYVLSASQDDLNLFQGNRNVLFLRGGLSKQDLETLKEKVYMNKASAFREFLSSQ